MATKKKLDPAKVITDLTEDFIEGLGVEAEVTVTDESTEAETAYRSALSGENLGIIIGYHGETLNALQLLLSLMVSKKLDQWVRLTLDAGEWRQHRGETLAEMATRAAERALSSGEEVALPVMSAADRRLIHLALQDFDGVTTESTGEEGYRRVVIKPAL